MARSSALAKPSAAPRQRLLPKPAAPAPATLSIEGKLVALEVRPSRRARRLLLRVDPRRDVVVLTLPPSVSRKEGLRFAQGHAAWIAERLAAAPARIPFAAGQTIPILGRPCRIVHRPGLRGATRVVGDELVVAGLEDHVRRRVEDYLRRRARTEIVARALPLAARLGRPIRGITLRDPGTRWGSCSPAAKLSFSWRLILAPDHVLDYVVAHEVAHLEAFDHSPRFWALVESLVGDMEPARAWLRAYGGTLHRYG